MGRSLARCPAEMQGTTAAGEGRPHLLNAALRFNVWNQVRFTYKQERQSTGSVTDEPSLLVLGAFNNGGAQVSNSVIEKMADAEDVASVVHGWHDFHFGGGVRPRFFSAEDSANFGGTFTFASLTDYENGKPTVFSCGFPSTRVLCVLSGRHAAAAFIFPSGRASL